MEKNTADQQDLDLCANNVNGAFYILQHSVVQKRLEVPKLVTNRINKIIEAKKQEEAKNLDDKLKQNLSKLEHQKLDSFEKIMESMPKGAKTEMKYAEKEKMQTELQKYSKWSTDRKAMELALMNKI